MKPLKACATICAAFFFSTFLLTAHASEGGENADQKRLLSKVDAITVNLRNQAQKYIQVELLLALANPEVGDRVKKYMSVIRNNLIFLLASKSEAQLSTYQDKVELAQEAKKTVNKALELTDKDGVKAVLFDSFIIQ